MQKKHLHVLNCWNMNMNVRNMKQKNICCFTMIDFMLKWEKSENVRNKCVQTNYILYPLCK